MAQVESLMVRLSVDVANFERNMQRATQTVDRIQSRIKSLSNTLDTISKGLGKVGKTMTTYVTAPLMGLGTIATRTSMTYESSLNQINRTLGESSSIIKDFAKNNGLAFNMSEKAAIKYGATYSNLLSSFISEQKDNAKLTEALLRQSAVISSWTGKSIEETMERIQSGLLGNTEAIDNLGINVNVAMIKSTEAFKKFANGKSWEQLDYKTQQQIRLFSILEQSVDKYGTTVNKTKFDNFNKLRAQLENIAVQIGDVLVPIISEFINKYIMPAVNAFKNMDEQTRKNVVTFLMFATIVGPVLSVLGKLFGVASGVTNIFSKLSGKITALAGTTARTADSVGGLSKIFGLIKAHPVIAAIVAIVGVLILLYNTSETVRTAIQNAWNSLKEFFGVLVQIFKQYIMQNIDYLRNAWDSIVVVITAIMDIFAELFGFLGALLTGDWKSMWEHAKNILKTAAGAIIVVVLNLIDNMLLGFQRLSEILLDKVFAGITKGFQGMVNGLLKGWNWLAGKFGWKQVAYLQIDTDKYKVSSAIQNVRNQLSKVADYWRGGEKAELPFSFGKSKVKKPKVPKLPNTDDAFNMDFDKYINDYASALGSMGDTAEYAKTGVDKLSDSVKNLVQSMRQQTESFRDSLSMFDKFERKVVSPERLMNRMKAQVKAMNQWTSALATLHNRGVNQSFLNELRAMGPQNVDYIRALAQMSDEQLAQYQSLYGQKYSVAQREAERMVMTEQKISKYVEQEISINITGNKISSDNDVDRIAKEIVRKLKLKGV